MIKVFTSNKDPNAAGDDFTDQFKSWKKEFSPNTIEILNIHSNSNKYGWMMIIHYKIIR